MMYFSDIFEVDSTVLEDFDALVGQHTSSKKYLPVYNSGKDMTNGAWVSHPYIVKVRKNDVQSAAWNGNDYMNYIYKLKWIR